MSGTTTTDAGASGGESISALDTAGTVAATDTVVGIFGGAVQNGAVSDIVAAGLPNTVALKSDIATALEASTLAQYTAQAQTSANLAAGSAAASQVNLTQTAEAAANAATILNGTQAILDQATSASESATNAVAGVAADANAAKVLLTAGIAGNAPGTYLGYWNASTNSPALTSGKGSEGDLYIVSVAGTTALDGNASWGVGDAAWFNNGAWQYFARAGWAAVAQSITALSSIKAGACTISTPGSDMWSVAWLDELGGVLAGLLSDGSPQFPGSQALIGPNNIQTSTMTGTGVVDLDAQGGVLANNSSLTWPNAVIPGRGEVAPNAANRAPGFYDDGNTGYATGDLWQSGGTLYSCVLGNPSGAAWGLTADVAPSCPGDVFGADLEGAWGVDAMVGGFTGAAFDVTTTVSGSDVVTTINIVSGGLHDANVLARALMQRDSGTTAEVTKLYDQSGNGYHLTGTYGDCPKIGVVTVNGFAAISFDTSGSSSTRALTNATISLAAGTFTALAFGRWAGTNAAANERIGLLTAGSVSTISGINEDGKLGLYDGTAYVQGSQYQPCTPSMVGISAAGGTSVSVWIGETSDTITVASSALSGAMTGFTLGNSGLGTSCNGVMTGIVVAKRAATTTDIQRANRSATLRWNYTPQIRPRIWCLGDSRTAGYLNPDCQNWPVMLNDYLSQPAEVFNLAVSGSMTTDFIPNTQPGFLAELANGGYNLAVIWIAINDFTHGINKPTTMQNIQNMAASALAAGVKHVWVVSEFYIPDQNWFWQYFPNGQHPNVTLLTPFMSDSPLSPNNDANMQLWHPDNLHPMPPSDRALASFIAASINPFIAQDLDQ